MQYLTWVTVQMPQQTKRFTGASYHWIVNDGSDAFLFERAVLIWQLGVSKFKPSEITFDHPYAPRYRGLDIMPRAKKSEQEKIEKPEANPSWKGFLNIKLSDDEFDVIDGISPTLNVGETLKWCADFGKVTLSYNQQNGTYNCTVTFTGGRLAGYAISSFSDTPVEALTITTYKIENYFDIVPLDGSSSGKAKRG